MIFGFKASARARAARFFIPPLKLEGRMVSTPSRPTRCSFSGTNRSTCVSEIRVCSRSGSPTFSAMESESNKAPPWKSIPIRFLRSNSSLTLSAGTSWPSTRTAPRSGSISPTTCFNRTDFPVPLRPMMTTDSPSATVKSTPRSTSFAPSRFQTPSITIEGSGKEHPEQERREEVVHDENQEARCHDRMRRRDPHPFGSSFALQPVITSHRRDDRTEEKRLDQPREHVAQMEIEPEPARERMSAHVEREHRNQVPAENRDHVREDREHGKHERRGHDPRDDQVPRRADSHGFHRVHLFGHAHGAQLGGDRGSDAPAHDERGKHRPQLDHHRLPDHGAQVNHRHIVAELIARLHRGHGARK